jgi:hypothetical protein
VLFGIVDPGRHNSMAIISHHTIAAINRENINSQVFYPTMAA